MGYIVRYIAARLIFNGLQRVGFFNLLVIIGAVVALFLALIAPYWKG